MSMNNLVNAYAALSDYRQVAALHMEVQGLRKRGFGADHPRVTMSMNNLVNVYAALRQFAALHMEVPALHKRGLGADHPDIAI